mmetsp:Transcript_575/g.1255  ORF Transcript_575/g.1255 Transcript_575/m.1255 type:complete len:206 (-) Transcript_575:173-790(-)
MCPNCSSGSNGPRSDLFSVGIVILELLTGRVQNLDSFNLFERYIEDGGDPAHSLSQELDLRPGPCPPEIVQGLESLARACLRSHRNRIQMSDVLGRLVSLRAAHAQASSHRLAVARVVARVAQHLECPLTLDLMHHPVVTPHGHTFEREAILAHLAISQTCPMTRQPLSEHDLTDNRVVRQASDEFRARVREDPTLLLSNKKHRQ